MKKNDFCNLINEGATLIDVRPKKEFDNIHLEEAISMPLEKLMDDKELLFSLNLPIIVCSGTGDSSCKAKKMIKEELNVEVFDAGPWEGLCEEKSFFDYLF